MLQTGSGATKLFTNFRINSELLFFFLEKCSGVDIFMAIMANFMLKMLKIQPNSQNSMFCFETLRSVVEISSETTRSLPQNSSGVMSSTLECSGVLGFMTCPCRQDISLVLGVGSCMRNWPGTVH